MVGTLLGRGGWQACNISIKFLKNKKISIFLFNWTFCFKMKNYFLVAVSGFFSCSMEKKIIYRLIKSPRFGLHAITFCLEIGYSYNCDG